MRLASPFYIFLQLGLYYRRVFFCAIKLPQLPQVRKPFRFSALFNKNALPASAVTVVFMVTFGALENFIAKFAAETNLPSGELFFIVMSITLFLTRLLVGKIADKKGERPFVFSANVSMFIAFLLLGFASEAATVFISAVLAGYAFGSFEPAFQSMAVHLALPEKRGSSNSTFLCAYDIGWGLGGGIAGCRISITGYHMMWLPIACANVVSVIVYLVWGMHHVSSFTRRNKKS
jgi:predicted MFS family arabinose efflux permease